MAAKVHVSVVDLSPCIMQGDYTGMTLAGNKDVLLERIVRKLAGNTLVKSLPADIYNLAHVPRVQ